MFVTPGELFFGTFWYLSKLNWLAYYQLPARLPTAFFSFIRKTMQPHTQASRRARHAAAPSAC